jgi:hypothetical protein
MVKDTSCTAAIAANDFEMFLNSSKIASGGLGPF